MKSFEKTLQEETARQRRLEQEIAAAAQKRQDDEIAATKAVELARDKAVTKTTGEQDNGEQA